MKYKLPTQAKEMLMAYLEAKGAELKLFVDKLKATEDNTFEQAEIIAILNYVVNRPYHEVDKIANSILPLEPLQEESAVEVETEEKA